MQEAVAMADPVDKLTERVIVPMTKDMVEAIKDFWHDNRLDSKSEAVRQLIEAGLAAKRKPKKH